MAEGLGLSIFGQDAEKMNRKSTTDAPLKGMLKQGNIGLRNRPVVKFGDKQQGTIRSASIGVDGKHVIIPTIYDGKKHKMKDAEKRYRDSGKNLGTFDTLENATAASKYFSRKQNKTYMMDEEK